MAGGGGGSKLTVILRHHMPHLHLVLPRTSPRQQTMNININIFRSSLAKAEGRGGGYVGSGVGGEASLPKAVDLGVVRNALATRRKSLPRGAGGNTSAIEHVCVVASASNVCGVEEELFC